MTKPGINNLYIHMFIEGVKVYSPRKTKTHMQEAQKQMKMGCIISQNHKVEKLFILYYNLRYISTPF